MIETFLRIVNMSLTASYVAIMVMIIRLILKKAPKKFSYILWIVVLFRLICPFSLESIFSLLPINSNTIPQDITRTQNPAINSDIGIIDDAVNVSINKFMPTANPVESINPMGILLGIASFIWILGLISLLCYGIFTYIRIKQRLSIATLVSDNIYEIDRIKVPFVLGFFSPKIYLPIGIKDKELDYILKHEKTHIKRRDYIIKFIAFIVLSIHWFNPIIWVSFILMVKDMEMSCDESVVKQSNEDIRVSYSEALLSMSMKQNGLISPLAFGEKNIKGRIKNILNYKNPKVLVIFILVVFITVVGIVLITNPKSTEISEKNFIKEIYKYRTEYVGDNSKVVNIVDRLIIPEELSRDHIQLFTSERPYTVEVTYKTTPSVSEYFSDTKNQVIFNRNAIIMFALIENVEYINLVLDDGKQNEVIGRSREWADKTMGQNLWESSSNIEQFTTLMNKLLSNSVNYNFEDEKAKVIENEVSQQVINFVESNLKIIMSSPKESSNPDDYIKKHIEYEKIIKYSYKYNNGEVLNYLLSQFREGNVDGLRGQIIMRLCKDLLGQRNNVMDESLSPIEWFEKLDIRQEISLPDYSYDGTDIIEKLVYETEIEKHKSNMGFTIIAPHIFGSYKEGNKLKVFVTTFNSHYRLYDKVLSQEGGGVIPAAITFIKNSDGKYSLEKYQQARDGAEFGPSIKEFCTMPVSNENIKKLADKILNHYGNYDDIRKLHQENLIKHLKINNQYGVSLYQKHYQKPAELIPLT